MATATNGSGSPTKKIKKTELGDRENVNVEDPEMCKREILKEIEECQKEIATLYIKAAEEKFGIDRNYYKLKKPHFEKRNDMIMKIPNFWAATFVHHSKLEALIDEKEVNCLQYVSKIEVEDSGLYPFKINFHFEANNPYIENEVLTKEVSMGANNDPISTSTPIRWKKGQNLCKEKKDSKASNSRKRGYPDEKMFFDWFCDNEDPQGLEIADIIRNIWQNPLRYFLNQDVDVEENWMEDEGDSEEEEGVEDDHIEDEAYIEGGEGGEGEEAEEDE